MNKLLYKIKRELLHRIKPDKRFLKLGVSSREIKKLQDNPAGKETVLFSKPIRITDYFWYIHGLNEIFIEEVYRFNSGRKNPFILDCGSNIGLSVIYFKRLFPDAEIIAFEADKEIAEILKNNLSQFEWDNITVVSKAVWTSNTVLSFCSNGSVGGRLESERNRKEGMIVETVRLKDYLDIPVDFLKIDIEGAEYEILKDCCEKLIHVKNIFVEYHSFIHEEQKLDEILLILKNAGFKYYIKEAWNNQPYPYINKRNSFFDLQLNIFGYRI